MKRSLLIFKKIVGKCLSTMAYSTSKGRTSLACVFHCVEDVLDVLRKPEFHVLPEVQELISIFNSEHEKCKKLSRSAALETSKKFPVIVLEGLDGSGKTTVTKKLSKKLSAVCERTPPDCLENLRAKFENHPALLRRAYYSLGNYIAADQVEVLRYQRPVMMDRFWHSTAAYTIASEIRESLGKDEKLPPVGDPIYNWPSDLLKPDVVLFLYVGEEIRNMRLSRRVTCTLEEEKLKEDKVYRGNLIEAFKRMRNPPTVKINSNLTINKVLLEINNTIGHIIEKCNVAGSVNSTQN